MKRSAAVIGPTPQFVRWAIAEPCPLRELDPDNLPESTFRQLRSIRALSEGISEGRVFEQICVHPSVTSVSEVEHARGFSVEEILDLWGGRQHLDRCCHTCPANACGPWAGCFGWLPADSSWSLDRAEAGPDGKPLPVVEDLPRVLDSVLQRRLKHPFEVEFGSWKHWYGLWRYRVLTPGQLRVLHSALELAIELAKNRAMLSQLLLATDRCLRFERELHVELVPPGFSNGSNWVVSAHCPDCKCAVQTGNVCAGCQRAGNFVAERKLKVLGYRPYLRLSQLLGEKATARFVERYVASKDLGELPTSDQEGFGTSEP
jgi:hypothetical protein